MICGLSYYQICLFFLIYSFLGWVLEVVFHAVVLGKIINRGFLNGPVCPVYAFGALGILALVNTLEAHGILSSVSSPDIQAAGLSLAEGKSHYSREALVNALENLFFAELVIIPWDRYEIFGHADGMVRYIGGERVLLNNYIDTDPYLRKRLLDALAPHFQVEELHYKGPRISKFSWAFLNYLQVKDCIFVPWLPISESRDVQSLFIDLFPDKQIEYIGPCEDIIHAGGALHCVTWNIQADPAPITLEEACF